MQKQRYNWLLWLLKGLSLYVEELYLEVIMDFIIISLNSTKSGGVFWLYFRLLGTILKIIFRYFSVFFGFWSGNWRGLFEILAGIF